nr:hypothetical protein [Tanacetum cinerariifolium]
MPWRHENFSVADPPPIGVRAEDIRRLFENMIDLRSVHPAILYEIGLTTIWKHVGHHLVFKDGEGTVATSMPHFLKFLMSGGVRAGKGTALAANEVIAQHTTQPLPFGSQIPEKSDYQKVVEHEDERVLMAKKKAQTAKDKAAGKRSAVEGTSRQTKKKKTAPMSFALSESEGDDSHRSGSGTHHSAFPLNTIIPDNVDLATGGGGLMLKFVSCTEVNSSLSERSPEPQHTTHSDEDTHAHFGEDGLHHDEGDEQAHRHAFGSTGFVVSSSSSGSGRQIDLLQRYKALNDDYGELYQSHRSYGDVYDRLTETQNQLVEASLVEKLAIVEKGKDDLLDKSREQEERIKQLKEDLASKTSSLAEVEGTASSLKGDLKRLTVDLSHAEIVRHNYVRQLLPTAFQRLFSSDEYKKSLSDVFNQSLPLLPTMIPNVKLPSGLRLIPFRSRAIHTWRSLPGSSDFLWEISKTCGRKTLFIAWPLALGLIRDVLRFGKCSSLGYRRLDSSGTSCVPGNLRHLTIGAWTHPGRLALREMFVTWPLALGLIRDVLRFGKCSSLGIGVWTHPGWETYVGIKIA